MNSVNLTPTDAQLASCRAGTAPLLTSDQVAAVVAANPIVAGPPPPPQQGTFTIMVAGKPVALRPTGFTVENGTATVFTPDFAGKRFLGNPGTTGCAVLEVRVGPSTKYAEFAEYAGGGTQHMVYASKTRGDLSTANLVSAGLSGQVTPKWKDGETWYLMFTNYVMDGRNNPTRSYPGGQMLVRVY